MKNSYSEKEIKIFNGVLKLARAGQDVSKLTAVKIAAAAGVGKATIYDYFSSKDEIINGALAYSLSKQKQHFQQEMERTQDFQQRMNIIYNGIIDSVQDTGSVYRLLLQAKEKDCRNCGSAPQIKVYITEFIAVLFSVLAKGYRQKIFTTDVYDKANESYMLMVILSNIFATTAVAKDETCCFSKEQIMTNSYTMLIKALA